ncbi:hypothetical protein Tco_0284714, partial [Tanacetum coccineum]
MVGSKMAMPSMTTSGVILVGVMESVQDMSGCRDSQKVKYIACSFVGKALTWGNSQIRTRGREATEALSREEFWTSTEMQKLKLSCGITSWSELAMLRILI